MAVLVGLGHHVGADIAAGAGLVLDHDRLADGVLQLGADQPRQDVGGAAGRKRHDDAHRLAEGLRGRVDGMEAENDDRERRKRAEPAMKPHASLPDVLLLRPTYSITGRRQSAGGSACLIR